MQRLRVRAAATSPQILYEDRQLLVAVKPAGFLTTYMPSDRRPQLETWLRERHSLGPDATLHAVSRLDLKVSGLIAFARSPQAIRHFEALRRSGAYTRYYLALASQGARLPTYLSTGLEPSTKGRRRVCVGGGKLASTRLHLLREHAGLRLLLLKPLTGRTHQLRVHSAYLGAPLLGDPSYGGVRSSCLDDGQILRWPQVMLHCYGLRLRLPGGDLRYFRHLPKDAAWQQVSQLLAASGTR